MSHDELSSRLDKQDRMLESIHSALLGDNYGNRGALKRLDEVETKQTEQERTMIKWAGIAAGASIVLTALKDRILGGS